MILKPGILPVLPTPFDADEAIDFSQYKRLIDFAVDAEVSGVCVPAYGSECYKLTENERIRILDTVIEEVDGRIPVIAQCNHTSPRVAANLAMDAQKRGASLVNTAVPRAFPASCQQMFAYCKAVCDSVDLDVIVQDWNPGGATIGLDFVERLHASCPNFGYIKYEESGIGSLMEEIQLATNGEVNIFSGWGGSFMLELIPAGLFGIMPGLSMADHFVRIWKAAMQEDHEKASKWFTMIAPALQNGLQNIEIFQHFEKRLLHERGVLAEPKVRSVTIELDRCQNQYMDQVIDALCRILEHPNT